MGHGALRDQFLERQKRHLGNEKTEKSAVSLFLDTCRKSIVQGNGFSNPCEIFVELEAKFERTSILPSFAVSLTHDNYLTSRQVSEISATFSTLV